MCSKGILAFCLLAVLLQNALSLPIGCQGPLNSIASTNQILQETMPGGPIITEIMPSLQFGDISMAGELPVGGSIRVKGVFPVYGTVAVDGGLPSSGTATVNSAVITQVI